MARRDLAVAILAIEGTNCDEELRTAIAALGARPEIVYLNQFEGRDVEPDRRRRLADYQMLLIPGGFSAGDYVRAGAIFAARLRAALGRELEEFVRAGKVVGGICNGFQVVVELGLLPGGRGPHLAAPDAVLMTNDSGHFECRPVFLAWQGGSFPALQGTATGTRFQFPVAHAEGKLVLKGDPAARLRALDRAGQVLFRYVGPDGEPASYPWNPNGSQGDVAGLSSPEGNVFGLMPHPERAFFRDQTPEWTRRGDASGYGDGQKFLDSVLRYAERAL